MTPLPSDFLRALARSLAFQATWNHRSCQAGGLVYALLPLLRRIHAGDPVALRRSVERHLGSFNAHPYLGPLAVGALARVEHEHVDPERIESMRGALGGVLGAAGDRLVWSAWRPFCLLAAVLAFTLGVGPWQTALGFLLLYNTGHLILRAWGLRRGWQRGLEPGSVVPRERLGRLARLLGRTNIPLLGAAVVLLSLRVGEYVSRFGPAPGTGTGEAAAGALPAMAGLEMPGWAAAAGVALWAAYRWPSHAARVAGALLIGSLLLGIGLG